jgi:hypothetical protein
MRKTFATLDDVLIERVFQPLSDAMADHLGLSRARAATTCIELSAIAWVLSQAPDLSDAVLGWQAASSFVHAVLLLLGLTALLSLRRLFRRISAEATANPLRPAMQPHRGVVLLLLAAKMVGAQQMGMTEAADMAMLGLVTAGLYLGACAARPPMQRVAGLPQAA